MKYDRVGERKMIDLSMLNPEQLQPTLDTEGVVVVSAGAGSGKTRLLTYRICHLIEDQKVDPSNILAITFTNKATREMKDRIASMLPNQADKVWISTFHSMCVRILRENIAHIEGYNRFFTIYDTQDKDKIITRILKSHENMDESIKKKVLYHMASLKNEGMSIEEYQRLNGADKDIEDVMTIIREYTQQLHLCNALDFDDLLTKTLELFKTCPDVLAYYQEKFRYIHVDEFQDTNTVQYTLTKMLCGKYGNLFVVGDEDQSIYGWRGANIENIRNILKDFPHVKVYKLEQNYRSTKTIIETANKLIKNNTARIDKTLWTDNEQGDKITYYSASDESDEAEYVARIIANKIREGYNYSDFAILSRVSALTMQFEQKLLTYNLPYIVYGNTKFFDRVEIKNTLGYLRVIANIADNESLARIINFPRRGIGATSIEQLLNLSSRYQVSMWEILTHPDVYDIKNALKHKIQPFVDLVTDLQQKLDTMDLVDFVSYVVKVARIKEEYAEDTEENLNRKLNIDALLENINSFAHNNENATIYDYLESVTLESSIEQDDPDDHNKVIVSTVHAVKGLEFKVVFIVGCEDGLFPISRALDSEEEMEEERRLMYVALTRAEKKCYLVRAKSRFLYGKRQNTMESKFIREMGLSQPQVQRVRDFQWENFATQTTTATDTLGKFKINQQEKKNFQEFQIGTMVSHIKFGIGTIISIERLGDTSYAKIDFVGLGVKTLALNIAPLKIVK